MTEHTLALGCMGFGGGWTEEPYDANHIKQAQAAIEAALAAGITFFDHANIYTRGKAEAVFGEVLKAQPGLRDKIYIQTKCGIRLPGDPPGTDRGRYDFSYDHIKEAVEASLTRLQVDTIDCLLLHRPDPLVEPDDVAKAFDELKTDGKVKAFGVSNHTPAQLALLQKSLTVPLVANQMEISLLHTDMLDGGIANHQCSVNPYGAEGTIEYCRLNDIRIQSWSPLAKGHLSGAPFKGQNESRAKRIEACSPYVATLAEKYSVPTEAIVIAWLLRHPAKILPVLGTKNPERIAACAKATEVTLTREEWYELFCLGRGEYLP